MNLTEVLIAAILSLAIFGVSYGFYAESREETNMERTCENLTALAGNIRVHRSDDLAGLLAMDVEGLHRADIIPPYFIGPNQTNVYSASGLTSRIRSFSRTRANRFSRDLASNCEPFAASQAFPA